MKLCGADELLKDNPGLFDVCTDNYVYNIVIIV